MNAFRWIIAGLLFVYFVGLASTNALTIIRFYLRGKKGSLAPLFGGLAGVLALLVVPIPGARAWCWLPLVFDFWTLPNLFFWLRRKIQGAGGHSQK